MSNWACILSHNNVLEMESNALYSHWEPWRLSSVSLYFHYTLCSIVVYIHVCLYSKHIPWRGRLNFFLFDLLLAANVSIMQVAIMMEWIPSPSRSGLYYEDFVAEEELDLLLDHHKRSTGTTYETRTSSRLRKNKLAGRAYTRGIPIVTLNEWCGCFNSW